MPANGSANTPFLFQKCAMFVFFFLNYCTTRAWTSNSILDESIMFEHASNSSYHEFPSFKLRFVCSIWNSKLKLENLGLPDINTCLNLKISNSSKHGLWACWSTIYYSELVFPLIVHKLGHNWSFFLFAFSWKGGSSDLQKSNGKLQVSMHFY